MVQTQFNTSIKKIHSDNWEGGGGGYMSGTLQKYFHTHGIIHQTTCIYTPQQNVVAERKNRHLLEVTRPLLLTTSVPKSHWGDALLTATYLINRMPSRVLDFKRPLEVLFSSVPSSTLIIPPRVFGCIYFVHLHGQSRSK